MKIATNNFYFHASNILINRIWIF